ncbi:hypothetical protein XPA_005645 [Xanthoria parietina]
MFHCCTSTPGSTSEVQEALKKPNEGLNVELSWQGLRIDPLAVLSIIYASRSSLHIQSAPPTSFVSGTTPELCAISCTGIPRIPRLIIDFQESTDSTEDSSSRSACPSWSKAEDESLPKKSIEHEQLDFWESVEINLPPSLATNGKLRTIIQQRIDAVMNRRTPLFDHNAYGQGMALLLASSSTALIHQTGQNSFQQLVQLSQQDGAQIPDARGVQEIWPHICCLTRSREEMSRLRWPAHWVKGFTSLTPCYGCEKLSYGVRRSRDFKYNISSPRDRGGEPLEALGGRFRSANRTAVYWQLESLFASG